MVTELIDEYCKKANINQGTFTYKGNLLSPKDCISLSQLGFQNGDEVAVN